MPLGNHTGSSNPDLQELKECMQELRESFEEVAQAVINPTAAVHEPLPKIAKPIRGVHYNRTINPITWMRAKIEEHNRDISHAMYRQFPDSSDHQIAHNAKRILGRLLEDKLGDQYGKVSWAQACSMRRLRSKCEQVIEDAGRMEEFHQLTYSYDAWAIRMLCDGKMKSAIRKFKTKSIPVLGSQNEEDPREMPLTRSEEFETARQEQQNRERADVVTGGTAALDSGIIDDDIPLINMLPPRRSALGMQSDRNSRDRHRTLPSNENESRYGHTSNENSMETRTLHPHPAPQNGPGFKRQRVQQRDNIR